MGVSLFRHRRPWRGRLRSSCLPAYLAALIGVALLALPVRAQTITPKDAVGRLFTGLVLESGWFTPSFLTAVSVDQVGALVSGLKGDFGGLIESL